MRKQKVVAIIQARETSTRFPRKIWADLAGKPVIRWVVDAAQAEGVDSVVVAAPAELSADPGCPVIVWSGPEDDVLGRYHYAARQTAAGYVVRLTADCPLVRSSDISKAVVIARAVGLDYVTNVLGRSASEGAGDGFDVEVIAADAIARLAESPVLKGPMREHVTTYIRQHLHEFHVAGFPASGYSQGKWSIDTEQDLERVRSLVRQEEMIGT